MGWGYFSGHEYHTHEYQKRKNWVGKCVFIDRFIFGSWVLLTLSKVGNFALNI